jgi:sortase A
VPSFLPQSATTHAMPIRRMLGLSLRRGGGSSAVSGLVGVLVVAAVAMFAYPAYTDIVGKYNQRHVANLFDKPQFQTLYRQGHVRTGQGITQLLIYNSRVKVNVLVVEGTSIAALQAGAGHYPQTPYPCAQGNVAIAGHRTTYGRPFNRINEMRVGDTVKLITPIGQCVYEVVPPAYIGIPSGQTTNPFIVEPDNLEVISQQGALGSGHYLTLTSCDPPGSAAQRIVLRLEMVSSTLNVHHKKGAA